MSGWALGISAVVGAGAQVYGATQQPKGISAPSPNSRPLGSESIFDQLSIESLYELGIPYEALEEEMLQRKLNAAAGPKRARSAIRKLNIIRARVASGWSLNDKGMQGLLKTTNKILAIGGASVSYVDGQMKLNFTGPEQKTLDDFKAKEARATSLKEGRLSALDQLNNLLKNFSPDASGKLPGEADASKYLNTFLDENYARQSEDVTNQANKLGISPGGQLAELQKALQYERKRIESGGALDRALAQANAQQGFLKAGLAPANAQNTLQYGAQASNDLLSSQALAQQLAYANAEAQSARAAGYSNLGGSILGAAAQVGSAYLSSNQTQSGLSPKAGDTSGGGGSGGGGGGSGGGGGGGGG